MGLYSLRVSLEKLEVGDSLLGEWHSILCRETARKSAGWQIRRVARVAQVGGDTAVTHCGIRTKHFFNCDHMSGNV